MIIRFGTSILVASAITFGLFYLMHLLITNENVELSEDKSTRIIDMIRVKKDEVIERIDRKPEKPPEPEEPPEIDLPQTASLKPTGEGINLSMAGVDTDVNLGAMGFGAPTDGDYLPIVRIEPQYPRRAQERGIEGETVVEFTVTRLGTVEDCVVIQAEPKGYFERESCKAAEKFKYKPKVVNGEPIDVTGVQTMFTFNMDQGR